VIRPGSPSSPACVAGFVLTSSLRGPALFFFFSFVRPFGPVQLEFVVGARALSELNWRMPIRFFVVRAATLRFTCLFFPFLSEGAFSWSGGEVRELVDAAGEPPAGVMDRRHSRSVARPSQCLQDFFFRPPCDSSSLRESIVVRGFSHVCPLDRRPPFRIRTGRDRPLLVPKGMFFYFLAPDGKFFSYFFEPLFFFELKFRHQVKRPKWRWPIRTGDAVAAFFPDV